MTHTLQAVNTLQLLFIELSIEPFSIMITLFVDEFRPTPSPFKLIQNNESTNKCIRQNTLQKK